MSVFEIGKTYQAGWKFDPNKFYTAGWQSWKYTVIGRTDKTVEFAAYHSIQPNWLGKVEKFRRKIQHTATGDEFIKRVNVIDQDIPIYSNNIIEEED